MNVVAENETEGPCQRESSPAYYRLHMPLGIEMRSLPARYPALEDAKRAFEGSSEGTRWCLIGAYEAGSEDAPAFVLQGVVRDEGVAWKSLAATAPPVRAAVVDRPKVVLQEQRMTKLLTPRLGYFTAEEVVKHVCARFKAADFSDENQIRELKEFLRRGLLAYVDPGAAEQLAASCAEVG